MAVTITFPTATVVNMATSAVVMFVTHVNDSRGKRETTAAQGTMIVMAATMTMVTTMVVS